MNASLVSNVNTLTSSITGVNAACVSSFNGLNTSLTTTITGVNMSLVFNENSLATLIASTTNNLTNLIANITLNGAAIGMATSVVISATSLCNTSLVGLIRFNNNNSRLEICGTAGVWAGVSPNSLQITGGSLSSDSTYFYRTFSAASDVLGVAGGTVSVDILVVAGGGSGGSGKSSYCEVGGGGGAGGLLYFPSQILGAGNYPCVVGAGGASVATGTGGPQGTTPESK